MKYSTLTERIGGDSTDAWEIHNRGVQKKNAGEPVIMLSIGQEDTETTPKHILDAAKASLDAGRHHYTPARGETDLREAIAQYHQEMTGQQVNINCVTVHSGAQNALYSIAQCLLEPGDEVILSEPYYTTYPATFTSSGAKPVSLTVSSANDFLPSPTEIINAITPNTRAIVLNSPSNPLGTVYDKSVFEPLLQACRENGIWLISDEVYAGLVDPARRFSPASLPGAEDVVATVSSVSKSHRMTGWRVGWVVGPPTLATHLANLSMCMHYGLPPFIMDAATVALQQNSDKHDIAKTIRAALADRRTKLFATLDTGNRVVLHDNGYGMFVLLDVEQTGLTAFEFAAGLLDQENVSALPCDGFGPSGKHLLRVGLCVDDNDIAQAGERISRYIKKLDLKDG